MSQGKTCGRFKIQICVAGWSKKRKWVFTDECKYEYSLALNLNVVSQFKLLKYTCNQFKEVIR